MAEIDVFILSKPSLVLQHLSPSRELQSQNLPSGKLGEMGLLRGWQD